MSRERVNTVDPWLRAAASVWLVLTLAVCARSAVQGERQSVYPTWQTAGRDWLAGRDLYEEGAGADPFRFGFRYSPLAAALLTPCGLMPLRAGNVVFRLVNAAAFLAAVAWWLRRGAPGTTTPAVRGLVYLLLAPLALGSLNNGQVNLIVIALLLACSTGAAAERWNLAAFFGAMAILLKLYPAAFVLLVAIAHPRRFLPRLLVALAVLLALPLALQSPEYVVRQYGLWWARISHNDAYRRFWPLQEGYRDVWLLIRVWQLPVGLPAYTALQLGAAGAAAALAVWFRLRLGAGKRLLSVLLLFSCAWMLGLGPAPESCTYVLIGPSLAWWLVQSRREGDHLAHYAAAFGYGLLLLCVVAGTHSRGIALYQVAGLQPLAVLLFTAGVLASPRTHARPSAGAAEGQGWASDRGGGLPRAA